MRTGERATVVPAQRRQQAMRAESMDQTDNNSNTSREADAPSFQRAADICLNRLLSAECVDWRFSYCHTPHAHGPSRQRPAAHGHSHLPIYGHRGQHNVVGTRSSRRCRSALAGHDAAIAWRDRIQPWLYRQEHRRRCSCRLRLCHRRARRGGRLAARPAKCTGRSPEPRVRASGAGTSDHPEGADGDAYRRGGTARRRLLRRIGQSCGANHVGGPWRATVAFGSDAGIGARTNAGRCHAARDGRAPPEGVANHGTSAAGRRARLAYRFSAAGIVQRAQPAGGARCVRRPSRVFDRSSSAASTTVPDSSRSSASAAPARRGSSPASAGTRSGSFRAAPGSATCHRLEAWTVSLMRLRRGSTCPWARTTR